MLAYTENVIILLGIGIILAWSLNVMVGYSGIFSVMQAVFYGIGAYASAQFAFHVSTDFILAAIVAMCASGFVAFVTAVPVLRVREEYYVVASIGFQMVASTVFITWQGATGGMGGLVGIPEPTLFGAPVSGTVPYLALTIGCVCLVLAALSWLLAGPFGRALKALRDDEVAAAALGKRPVSLRLAATAISGALAGLGGTLYAFYVSFVNPDSFTLDYSVLLVAMVVIGGAGSLVGPVLGAIFITVFPALLTFVNLPSHILGPVEQIVYGSVIVLLMLFLPEGLVGAAHVIRWQRWPWAAANTSPRSH